MASRRNDLMNAIELIQRHRAHRHHDIVGTCSSMTDAELARHVEACMLRVAQWSNYGGDARRLSRTRRTAA